MTIISGYRNDDALRAAFNRLAKATFGLDFEGWYQNGFWGDSYNPYSVLEDGRIVANVSLNRTDLLCGGRRLRLCQLGTVMTDPAYRNRGYIRAIMEEIEKDTKDADGVYLFGGDNVLSFYPKFGFVPGSEFVHEKDVCQQGACRMQRVMMDGPDAYARLRRAMGMGEPLSALSMADNPELIFFYVSQFMRSCVYTDPVTGAWAIAEMEEGCLVLHNVFCTPGISLDDVIAAFGAQVRRVSLGFTPGDASGYTVRPYHEEDCTFFVRGSVFDLFEQSRLRIPSLSHA